MYTDTASRLWVSQHRLHTLQGDAATWRLLRQLPRPARRWHWLKALLLRRSPTPPRLT